MSNETVTPDARPASKRRTVLKWARRILIVGLIGLLAVMLLTRLVTGDSLADAVVQGQDVTSPPKEDPTELILFSVNCAHGRGEGMHQALTSSKTLRANCEAIGKLLASGEADIACLQECDASSWWSGGFDHAKLIGTTAKLPRLVHSLNVEGAGLQYGTAVMSNLDIDQAQTLTFRPTPPTFSKGVAIARVAWPGDATFKFDVVSVHLDFASASARAKQVDELIEAIKSRGNPVIIAGDLNCDWSPDGATRKLASALELTAFEPETEMITFPFTNDRLDWVLVSKEFQITSVEAIDAKLSDHRPLRAVIRRVEGRQGM
jgi:endonuclease/exonuclease/phosphatase family metal-dependent hydrolase